MENPPFGPEVGFLALDVGAKLVRWCEGGGEDRGTGWGGILVSFYVFKSHWERKKIRYQMDGQTDILSDIVTTVQ